jgi:glycosyltransferase involved in cell wall biosynthesis
MRNAKSLELLFTTRALVDGGAERVWVTIAKRFAERGDRVTLAVDDPMPGLGLDETTNPRVLVLGKNHVVATARLMRELKARRPDVALAALSGSCTKLAVASALSLDRTPIVLSYHGFEEYKTGRLAAAAYYGLPIANRVASRIIAVSEGLERRLIEHWGADPTKTQRIYNPVSIDLAQAAQSAGDIAQRPPIVLGVGRLSPEKGFVDLIDAFARMMRSDARLVIAGEGPERCRLVARVDTLGLADRVTFLGHVGDPTPLYRKARVVAIPSRTEAFGLVVVEALAHGLPVVATACEGPMEILESGRFGRIVAKGDTAAMTEALTAALEAPGDPAPRIARAACFSFEEGFAEWERLVDGLAAHRSA